MTGRARWGLLKIWERAPREKISAFIFSLGALSHCSLSLSEIERRHAAFKQSSPTQSLNIIQNDCASLRGLAPP